MMRLTFIRVSVFHKSAGTTRSDSILMRQMSCLVLVVQLKGRGGVVC
jgi:hypothetical protein